MRRRVEYLVVCAIACTMAIGAMTILGAQTSLPAPWIAADIGGPSPAGTTTFSNQLFTVAANFSDPDVYFLGGGVVEAAPGFTQWFLNQVREHTQLRDEQKAAAQFSLVPDRDMAGARGAAVAAFDAVTAEIARTL